MTADVVVLGAGLAGLALGARVAAAGGGPRPRVVLLDPRTSWDDDRTWCWFDRPGGGPQHLVDAAWARWRVSTHDGRAAVHDGGHRAAYHRVRASRFHDHALTAVDAADHVVLRPGVRATGVHRHPTGLLTVRTDAGELTARAVVDTRPPTRERALRSPLLQVFAGVEIATDRPVLEPTTVGLMERLTSDEHGLRFDYVLPTSPTTALVEATRFAPGTVPDDVLASDLDAAVAAATTGAGDVLRGRTEAGVLPMGLPAAAPTVAGVVRAGVGGGALRPATGYGFRRTLAWAATCAARIAAGEPPVGHPVDPTVLAALDATFLRAVRRDPDAAPDWFLQIARALPAAGFARFLSERATTRDLLRVVRALPPLPLARSAVAA